ncbi:MAG: response regulator [Opitutaceae bacterium]
MDDAEDNRVLTAIALGKGFPGSVTLECATLEEAIGAAGDRTLDAVITDHHLGAEDGEEFMRALRAVSGGCPVVMVTASSDPSVHRRAYAAGAHRVFAGADFDFVPYLQAILGVR